MTITEKSPHPAFSRMKAQAPSNGIHPQNTPGVTPVRIPAPLDPRSLPSVETVWLGDLLRASRDTASRRINRVTPDDFSSPYTRTVFDLAQRLVIKGQHPDAATVEAEAIRLGVVPDSDRANLATLLLELLDSVYAPRDHPEPVTTTMLIDASARRRFHSDLTRCWQLLNEGGNDSIREHAPGILRDAWAQTQRLSQEVHP